MSVIITQTLGIADEVDSISCISNDRCNYFLDTVHLLPHVKETFLHNIRTHNTVLKTIVSSDSVGIIELTKLLKALILWTSIPGRAPWM